MHQNFISRSRDSRTNRFSESNASLLSGYYHYSAAIITATPHHHNFFILTWMVIRKTRGKFTGTSIPRLARLTSSLSFYPNKTIEIEMRKKYRITFVIVEKFKIFHPIPFKLLKLYCKFYSIQFFIILNS